MSLLSKASSKSETKSLRRFLLSRLFYIGDVVLTTPAIRALREAFPEAFIAYLGDKQAVSLLEQNPFLDEIIPFDFTRPTLLEQPRVVRLLRRRHFDVAIDFLGNPRSAIFTYLSGAPVRIGGDFRGRRNLYTIRIHDDGLRRTAVEFHLRYLEPLGIHVKPHSPELFLSPEERSQARDFLLSQGIDVTRPVIGLHAGATWPAKMWLKDRFIELAAALYQELGLEVIFTQGPKDSDLMHEIGLSLANHAKILPVLSLRELAAVLSQCTIFVANDSGPMHIAAAVGTTTIGIFGPGEDDIWFPYDALQGHIAVRHNVPCHPCHLNVCNRTDEDYMACMKGVSTEHVFSLISERLSQAGK